MSEQNREVTAIREMSLSLFTLQGAMLEAFAGACAIFVENRGDLRQKGNNNNDTVAGLQSAKGGMRVGRSRV